MSALPLAAPEFCVALAFALLFMAAVDRVDVVMRLLLRVLIFSSGADSVAAFVPVDVAGVLCAAADRLAWAFDL